MSVLKFDTWDDNGGELVITADDARTLFGGSA